MSNIKNPQEELIQKIHRVKRKNPAKSFLKSFCYSFAIIIVLICVVSWNSIQDVFIDLTRVATGKNTARFEFKPFSAKRQNILLLGVDISENEKDPFKGVRSDSINIISIAPYGVDVNIISIPRDSKVYPSGAKFPDKINHTFAKGGINLTASTIEETFGIRINNYLVISTKAVKTFIDEIGGIPIYVEKNMHYGDRTAGLFIDLKKGENLLNGDEVEGYLRFRHDKLGDIGRISRQQWFLNALEDRLKNPEAIVKLPSALKHALKFVQTDLSSYQLMQFTTLAKTIKTDRIHTIILPGIPSSREGASYWILDPEKTQNIMNRFVYRDNPNPIERPIEIGILYTIDNIELANSIKDNLIEKGYNVTAQNREEIKQNKIAVHNFDVSNEIIDKIKKQDSSLDNFKIIYDFVGFSRGAKDLTILLGR